MDENQLKTPTKNRGLSSDEIDIYRLHQNKEDGKVYSNSGRKRPKSINQELEALESTSSDDSGEKDEDQFKQQDNSQKSGIFVNNLLKSFHQYYVHELEDCDVNLVDSRYAVQRERVSNFLRVPVEIEKLMLYGYGVCLNSFLAIFTVLPIRLLMALLALTRSIWDRRIQLGIVQTCDLLRGLLLFTCTYFFMHLDASRLYHSIRGQAVIKLYVIFNVLEIADRLCCSFGQDILDSLFSKFTLTNDEVKQSKFHHSLHPIAHFLVAVIYVSVHTLVLFYQVITLNVAINSHNNALFTLLVSNQFVEIKGSVFKRFEKENLFQVSCSDIVERFQLSVFLIIISLRNLLELGADFPFHFSLDLGWFYALARTFSNAPTFPSFLLEIASQMTVLIVESIPNAVYDYLSQPFTLHLDFGTYVSLIEVLLLPVLTVFFTEVLVDWLKHAFITKFNQIRPNVYSKYLDILCKDYVLGRDANMDDTYRSYSSSSVSRRIGFASIPLACLLICIFLQSSPMITLLQCNVGIDHNSSMLCNIRFTFAWLFFFVCLLLFHCISGLILQNFSVRRYEEMQKNAEKVINKRLSRLSSQKVRPPAFNADIQERNFFSMPNSPIVPDGNSTQKRIGSAQSVDSMLVMGKEVILENHETEIIGDIKIPHPEGKVSLENIDRYTLFKSRIP